MNHPKPEEWVQYIFAEAGKDARQRLNEHLQNCAECREEIAGWKRSLGRLNAWKLPKAERPRETVEPLLKWAMAAAAVVVLGVGFSLGRLTSTTAEVEKVRAAIEPGIRQQMRQEFAQLLRDESDKSASGVLAASGEQTKDLLADFAVALDTRLAEDNQAIYAALDKLDSQRVADYVSLKKDLDTVAVNTDVGLRHTEQQLVQLADYAQPANFPNSPQK